MKGQLNYHQALLIEANDSALAEIEAVVTRNAANSGLTLVQVSEGRVAQYLHAAAAAGDVPAVVLLGPRVEHRAAIARELQLVCRNSHVIFLQSADVAVGNSLQHIPRTGLHWSLVDVADPALAKAMVEAVQSVQRRARLQTTIDRANSQLASFGIAGREDYGRRVISDHYLANFLAHARDAIVAVDPEFRVLYWSAGAENLFGIPSRDVINTVASRLPFWSPQLMEQLSLLRGGQDTAVVEVACDVPRGHIVVEIVCSSVRDEIAGFMGTALVIRDVSVRNKILEAERAERSRVASAIDNERRHLRSLFKQAPGFIAVTTGPSHIFEVANDAFYQIVGHRSILGKPVRDALPEMQEQEFFKLLDRVYTSGEPYVGRSIGVSVQRTPGAPLETLYVDFVFQPIIESDGTVTGTFCQGTDITEHKLTQEKLAIHQSELEKLVAERTKALEHSQRALQRSEKLEAIGKLTGGVAHDFNNVLQIIAGNLQLMQLESDQSEQTKKYLSSAVDAVDRGAKLAAQLLAFARRQPLQPVVVNLARILRDMDDLLRRALGETIELETRVSDDLWHTAVDPHRLENVILNLAINARDAMPEGGKLTLELENAVLDDQYVLAHPDVSAGQYAMIVIRDTGKGMPPEVMERAFDPFFTTKKEGEGTGLGLSMAYGFVKQSEGHIKVYSEYGKGTTFRIYLPRSCEAEVKTNLSLRGPVVGGSETILVVEDDPAVQETVVRMLEDLGYNVLNASDGQGALTILHSGESIDMLFTDVVMPGPVRSPDLARQAKRLFPDIAVLFTSGYTQNAIVHGGRLDPGVELLSKPYRREDLARKIRHVLANARRTSVSLKELGQSQEDEASSALRILVVEDDLDSQEAVCQLIGMLGHKVKGVDSAEAALELMEADNFDVLFTDVSLPGMNGTELARIALADQPLLKIIIASGYGLALDDVPDMPATILPKPFDLARLRQALSSLSH